MRQVNLPLIPDSAIDLGSCFSVFFEKEYVTWFHGLNVINRHRRDDLPHLMVRQLLQTLNETMTVFPGTDMMLNYSLLT